MTDGEGPGEHVLDFQGTAEIIYLGEKQSDAYSAWREERTGRRGGLPGTRPPSFGWSPVLAGAGPGHRRL